MKKNVTLILLVLPWFLVSQNIISDYEWKLNAKSSFLYASRNDLPLEPLIVDLNKIGLNRGDSIRLLVTGDYSMDVVTRKSQKTARIVGVFSKTNYLLAKNNKHRIPDAIDFGEEELTDKTYFGREKTDINEDFKISNTKLRIPKDANFLFVGINDSYFKDNGSSNNFKLILTHLSTKIQGRDVKYIDEIKVNNEVIKISIWDNQTEDGDIITIYLNNQIIIENLEVKKKKQKLKIRLREGTNSLVMFAQNLGDLGKNTAAFKIQDKGIKRQIVFNSDKGVSEGLILNR